MKITFNGSPNPTLGVELELQILDPETMNLVGGSPRILAASNDEHVKPELIESTIELNTNICPNVAAVRLELGERIRALLAVCDELGYTVACAGTHPFSKWAEQRITPEDRYRRLVDRCQWPARRLMIFGLHVHVGVQSGEKAIALFNSMTTCLPHLLALSASSPFFTSADTGLASCRVKIFESLPTAGLPYRFLNWAEFQRLMVTLVNANAIESVCEIWWDVRPHHNFGTVEVRVCDMPGNLQDTLAITALIQCLVKALSDDIDQGAYQHDCHPMMVLQNKWRSCRYGLEARLVDTYTYEAIAAKQRVEQLVRKLRPAAEELGCVSYLESCLDIAARPNWSERQRSIFRETGDPKSIVRQLTELSRVQPRSATVSP